MFGKIWDKIGICASGLCLVHCLATPILLLFFPTLKIAYAQHNHIHEIFAVVIIISIMFAVFPHCRKHGHKDIIAFAITGVLFILLGVFLKEYPAYITDGLTIIGSVALIIAHIKNMKVRHGKCEPQTHHCSHH